MPTSSFASNISRRRITRAYASTLVLGLAACSSSSSGLKTFADGSVDGRTDSVATIDGVVADGAAGLGGAGDSSVRLDAATGGGGAGGTVVALDGGSLGAGGAGGAIVALDGGGVDGVRGSGGTGPSGTGGDVRGSGGAGGAGGSVGSGGATARDAGPMIDGAVDVVAADLPLGADAADDTSLAFRDATSGRGDVTAVDVGEGCGDLGQSCCVQRTCNLPSLVCDVGASGGNVCVACGGENEACCDGDTCTAPGTTCTGGRGGTCR